MTSPAQREFEAWWHSRPLAVYEEQKIGCFQAWQAALASHDKLRDAVIILEDGALIPLTQERFAVVDKEDLSKLNNYEWYCSEGYARASVGSGKDSPRKHIKMHRFLLGITDPLIYVDHINGNGLDNRKCNLRTASARENRQNSRPKKGSKSRFKGVAWHAQHKKW